MEISLELILGIIGTITGVLGTAVSTILYLLKYRKDKPILEVTTESCKHKVSIKGRKTDLRCGFVVKNKGDRDTTINKLEVSFLDSESIPHRQTKNLNVDLGGGLSEPLNILFEFTPPFQYRKKFECNFVLYHTHGKHPFSKESEESDKHLSDEGYVIV